MAWSDTYSSRSGHCDTVDTPAPPPDPIGNIYNTSSDILDVLTGRTSQTVEVSVRLECVHIILYERLDTLFGVLHSLSFSWDEPELNYNVEPIQQYQAHLALEPLDPDSEGDATAGFSVGTRNTMHVA